MALYLRGNLLVALVSLGLTPLATAGEQDPSLARWAKSKCQDGISRAGSVCAGATTFASTPNARRLEEFARDAYFSLIELKEDFARKPAEQESPLAGENADFYLGRARVRCKKREYDAAISDLTVCLRLAPGNVAAYYLRGLAWGAKHEYYRGICDLDRCLRLEPRVAEAYGLRGAYWLTLGDAERALVDFDDYVRCDGSAKAHAIRALAWIRKLQPAEAQRDLEQAVRLASETAYYHYLLGSVRLWAGDDRGAIKALNRALELSPKLSGAYLGRAIARQRLLRPTLAAEDLDHAKSLNSRLKQQSEPASNCTVGIVVKETGAGGFTFWLKWQNLPVNKAGGAETAANAYGRLEYAKETNNRFRRKANMPHASFDFFQASLSRGIQSSAHDRSTFSTAPPFKSGSSTTTSDAAQNRAHRDSPDPTFRRRADELNQLAWDLATSRYVSRRDGVQAVEAAREACELTRWKDAACIDTLAAAYAECGDFESADKFQSLALEAWPQHLPGRQKAEGRWQRYRAHQPLEPIDVSIGNYQRPQAPLAQQPAAQQLAPAADPAGQTQQPGNADAANVNTGNSNAAATPQMTLPPKLPPISECPRVVAPRLSDDDRETVQAITHQAWLLATSRYESGRDGVRAVEAAREACEMTEWRVWGCVEALAAAYAECGDFESADKYQTLAEELAADGPPNIRHAAARRHALYRDRRPVHQGE